MNSTKIGYAMCGSFCTIAHSLAALNKLSKNYSDITPVISQNTASTDTRFFKSEDIINKVENICGKKVISTIKDAEPIGPKKLLDVLVVAPCTGNTLGKIANGITDTSVTMAVKAHLRNDRPVVLCIATNDAQSASAKNIGLLLNTKNIYFVPFYQDDCKFKERSLIGDFEQIQATIDAALAGKQLQPLLTFK
ncbi:MAG: dipicolinate synthase subunit B [Oscillospiraceae bacterium]|nr:dipicolinate synthase subunit B [Candidatus Equicaccousia limihippi]